MKKKASKKSNSFKIGFIGCKNTTYDCIKSFKEDGFDVDCLITLNPRQGKKFKVAGYMDLKNYARKNKIELHNAKKYSLKDKIDYKFFKDKGLDLLITMGWQRLIPEEVLNCLKIGAVGMHGSAMGLPKGRGRSPLNWSLILGKKSFITSLILYSAGVDSGAVIGSQKFEINEFDDCQTLHFKNRIAMNSLLKKHVPLLLRKKAKLTFQNEAEATYYPKREPEDGGIDWNMDSKDIYDFIRAQTKPFYGAFSFINKSKIIIWKAQNFDRNLKFEGLKNGEIIDIFSDNKFLVKTPGACILVTKWEGPLSSVKKGSRFVSVDFKENIRNASMRYPLFVKENQKEIKS